jgi:ferredoxin
MPETAQIRVDRDACIGSGLCVVYAPATFAHDDAAKATVVDAPGDSIDQIRTAVEACPMEAISLHHDDRGM